MLFPYPPTTGEWGVSLAGANEKPPEAHRPSPGAVFPQRSYGGRSKELIGLTHNLDAITLTG